MSTEAFDYSPEAFAAALGDGVMSQIRASVAAAPPPSPEQVERLRAIFAPALVRRAEAQEEVKAA